MNTILISGLGVVAIAMISLLATALYFTRRTRREREEKQREASFLQERLVHQELMPLADEVDLIRSRIEVDRSPSLKRETEIERKIDVLLMQDPWKWKRLGYLALLAETSEECVSRILEKRNGIDRVLAFDGRELVRLAS
jgi:hypothetical protein